MFNKVKHDVIIYLVMLVQFIILVIIKKKESNNSSYKAKLKKMCKGTLVYYERIDL